MLMIPWVGTRTDARLACMQNFVCMGRVAIAACVGLVFASAAPADEIYKWVDKDGKTHYSSRPEDAAGAQTQTMRPAPPPPGASTAPPPASSANEDIIRRRSPAGIDREVSAVPVKKQPEVREVGRESPAYKCWFARQILAGHAEHGDGKPINAWDREVAQNDVRVYCPQKGK